MHFGCRRGEGYGVVLSAIWTLGKRREGKKGGGDGRKKGSQEAGRAGAGGFNDFGLLLGSGGLWRALAGC